MRWSAWRAKAPFKDSVQPKVLSIVDDALAELGADPDPECWVVWGDDPSSRYTLLVPTPSGLVLVNVRVSVPGEGPRAGGKVVRWPRVQLGELAVEIQGGHRLVTFQVETQVLNGADAAADAIAVFAQTIFAAVDGRPAPAPAKGRATATKAGPASKSTKAGTGSRAGASASSRQLTAPKGFSILIEAVIFDMDGVIVDSEIWWDEVRSTFAAANGRVWTADDQAAVMGANSPGWARIMRERLHLDLPEAAIERAIVDGVAERYRREGAPRIDGAIEAVRRIAADRPVALASSSHREVIDEALAATGLGSVFSAVVSSDDVTWGKPAPDVYLEAARQLGVAPGACLVVEDSYNGVRAGKAAGMFVVLVPNGSVPPAAGTTALADLVLDRLADLDPDRFESTRPAAGPGEGT